MAQLVADRRDVDFVLHEQLNVADLSKHKSYAEFNKKTVDLIISEARNLAVKELLPIQIDGDREGARFESGNVTVPDSFHKAWDLFKEGEWVALSDDPELGGQGMPVTLSLAVNDYFIGANFAFMMYPGLTHGAGRLIQTFGTAKQKKLFLKKMFTGEWTGTMLLTEPEAGSDVGALTTSAVKNDDGTYSITGNKIFISSGEHTKGISLFLVPKIRVNDDGSLGEFNDVVCTGVEEKLGIHGNATCSLSLGSKGNCQGTLLGEKNKGMRAMFQMMNEARLLVGLQGLACASAAYLYAVNYARERVQGRHLLKALEDDAPLVPIIEHPDIRRMLLTMKVYVEGMRSLLYYIGNCQDKFKISAKEEDKAKYQGLMDLLIPIAKGYVTDKAFEVCSLGVQVYGGYGYIKEYPMEQLLRDCRITQIYEGTNGIQAMDLLGRKLGMNKGKPIMDLLGEIQQTIAGAKSISNLADIANKVEAAVNKLGEVALHIGQIGMSPDTRMNAFAHAYNFMEVSGDVIFAWLLLWRASIAAQNLENGAGKRDAAYFEGQLKSAEFFVHSILPVTLGKMDVILTASSSAVDISEDAFGGK
jgi:alkylation response protein AidB-like acyl-CoA dehydrogenase